jgi:hypothetical protein
MFPISKLSCQTIFTVLTIKTIQVYLTNITILNSIQ